MSGLEFIAGTLFGSSLLLSGVYSPAVITSQLQLSNFHMLESFLVASAVSAGVVLVADISGYSAVQIREPRQLRLNVFGSSKTIPFSANILGGALLGLGMALTGACPGTVLVQMATGIKSGWFVACGGILGGVLFALTKEKILGIAKTGDSNNTINDIQKKNDGQTNDSKNIKIRPHSTANTLQNKLGLSTDAILLGYEVMCAAMIFGSVTLAPKTTRAYLPPPIGGLVIGMAQAATLLMTRRTVGVSGAYGDIGRWLVSLVKGKSGAATETSFFTRSVVFAFGIFAGSLALAMRPDLVPASLAGGPAPEPLTAFLGGIASIYGASLAGGCTSGHGISGMATFSVASFVTVATMFGGGIVSSMILT